MPYISINSVNCYSMIIKVLKAILKNGDLLGFLIIVLLGHALTLLFFICFQTSLLTSRESGFLSVYCAVLVMGSGL